MKKYIYCNSPIHAKIIQEIIEKTTRDRDRFWSKCLKEHRIYCTEEGNKQLTGFKKRYNLK